MSEKSMEFMKKVLEMKKEKQGIANANANKPQKKMGSAQSAFKSTKTGGAKKI